MLRLSLLFRVVCRQKVGGARGSRRTGGHGSEPAWLLQGDGCFTWRRRPPYLPQPLTRNFLPNVRTSTQEVGRPMRITVLSLIAAAALAAPIAALAGGTPTTSSAANDFCKQQQTTLGASFAAAYKTFGKCVSSNTKNARNA